ncbi:hypothetical protein [Streptomyces sp. MST-110588]|nr:hypothetical protein [Streptomyces sp. MST-110588]
MRIKTAVLIKTTLIIKTVVLDGTAALVEAAPADRTTLPLTR